MLRLPTASSFSSVPPDPIESFAGRLCGFDLIKVAGGENIAEDVLQSGFATPLGVRQSNRRPQKEQPVLGRYPLAPAE